MVQVVVIETSELGDRTYIVTDGSTAVVVDPQRDIDRVIGSLEARELTCLLVLETHIHNDYVSGGLELARRTGAEYVVAGSEMVGFPHKAVADGDHLNAGNLHIRVVATPGHTDGHVAYVVDNGSAPAVFTGGSLLYGSVGRTDLVDPARTEELTRNQYRSARLLSRMLPDEAGVYPTHGFGSFCSSGAATGGTSSTIGIERLGNDALTTDDEDAFVANLIAGLTAYPTYYAHMGPRNRAGAGPIDLSAPVRADGDELRRRIAVGEWVVDLRSRTAFAGGHVRGTVGFPLDTQFSTYIGWLIPWDMPLTLLSDSAEDISDAQRQLVRIGIDRPEAGAVGRPDALVGTEHIDRFPIASFTDLRDCTDPPFVLDVRRHDERRSGHLEGSRHIELHALTDHLHELPAEPIWVHCASGYRASIAASLLDRAGMNVVLIDDDWSSATEAGLTVVGSTGPGL